MLLLADEDEDALTRLGQGLQALGHEVTPFAVSVKEATELIARSQESIATTARDIRTKSGAELFDFILADIREMRRVQFESRSIQAIMAGMEATWWLNERLQEWLGEKNAADTLTQSVPHNVTSEMGLALLDVADVIRPHREVVAFLHDAEDEGFLDGLVDLEGGREARDAIQAWLDEYGMRCVGEIDITRPRWSERPTSLLPMILANIENFEPGAGQRDADAPGVQARRADPQCHRPHGDRRGHHRQRGRPLGPRLVDVGNDQNAWIEPHDGRQGKPPGAAAGRQVVRVGLAPPVERLGSVVGVHAEGVLVPAPRQEPARVEDAEEDHQHGRHPLQGLAEAHGGPAFARHLPKGPRVGFSLPRKG